MIISNFLKEVLTGFAIDGKAVNFGYGDINELERFIAKQSKTRSQFPIIWYTKPNYTENSTGEFSVRATFILMTSTKFEYYNEERCLLNYVNILQPLKDKFIDLLSKTKNVRFNINEIEQYDEGIYGIDVYRNEFNNPNNNAKPKGASVQVYVDSKRIDLKINIKIDCQC
jgi:hypothetical protein